MSVVMDDELEIGGVYSSVNGEYFIVLDVAFGNPEKALYNPTGIPNTSAAPYWAERIKKVPLISVKVWSLKDRKIRSFAFPSDHFSIYFHKL